MFHHIQVEKAYSLWILWMLNVCFNICYVLSLQSKSTWCATCEKNIPISDLSCAMSDYDLVSHCYLLLYKAIYLGTKRGFSENGKQFRVVTVDLRPKLEGQSLLWRLIDRGLNTLDHPQTHGRQIYFPAFACVISPLDSVKPVSSWFSPIHNRMVYHHWICPWQKWS